MVHKWLWILSSYGVENIGEVYRMELFEEWDGIWKCMELWKNKTMLMLISQHETTYMSWTPKKLVKYESKGGRKGGPTYPQHVG